MHIISSLIPSPHTGGFHKALTNGQPGPVCMNPTCCVSVVWSWTASTNNQSLWHRRTKKRGCSASLARSQKHRNTAPGQHLWSFVLLRAKTIRIVARAQGNMICIVARYTLQCPTRCSECYPNPQIFLSAVFSPGGQQETEHWWWQEFVEGLNELSEGRKATQFLGSAGWNIWQQAHCQLSCLIN